MKKIFLTLACVTAVKVGALFAFHATRTFPESTVQLPIAQYLPTGEAEGWTYEDLPLGETESLDARAHEILNLTDFVYRRYTRGSQSFEIYIAYWEPGKMPARLMNSHTPDTCWGGAGWKTESRESRVLRKNSPAAIILAGLPMLDLTKAEGSWRIFRKESEQIEVLFWHLLNNDVYQYGHQSMIRKIERLVMDPFRAELDARGEQWLVRVATQAKKAPVEKQGVNLKSDSEGTSQGVVRFADGHLVPIL